MYLKPQFRAAAPQYTVRDKSEERSKVLKTLIKGKAWIPGGHPNSLGRNKLGAQTRTTLYY